MTVKSNFNLDKRINSIDDIQTILQHDVNCIGCKGYFFDEFVDTQDLSQCRYGELVDIITDNHDLCFKAELENKNTIFFRFFIPENDLKPVEKKYRPFTPDEFTDTFTIGEPIIFRRKQSKRLYEYNVLFIGCCFSGDNTDVVLGNDRFSLETLFNNYEWRQHGSYEWKPFGVLDEEKE